MCFGCIWGKWDYIFVVFSCKDAKDKDPKDVIIEDFIGAYTFEYTFTSHANFNFGTVDTSYNGTRTIFVEKIEKEQLLRIRYILFSLEVV